MAPVYSPIKSLIWLIQSLRPVLFMTLFFGGLVIRGLAVRRRVRSLLGRFPRRLLETERVVAGIAKASEAGIGEKFEARGAESLEAMVSEKPLEAVVCEKPLIARIRG